MTLKDQVLHILEESRATELKFIANLTDEDRAYQGTYEKWSAKDSLAHVNYWQDVRAARTSGWMRGEEVEPIPQIEQANAACYDRYHEASWDEIVAFAEQTHTKMVGVLSDMDEDTLRGPSQESEGRKLWESIVGTTYTHKLMHYAQFFLERGRKIEASQLWNEWAGLVSPLDAGPQWQGGAHYNAACGLALAGDHKRALEELRKGIELRPSLKAWSRRDTDLEILHDLPEYKKFYAPDFWWQALESNPQGEALADQFVRTLSMFRLAVNACPEKEWLEGESLYQRPAGLSLHIAQSVNYYSTLKPGEVLEDPLTQVNWEDRDSSKLPSRTELLRFLDRVEERLAKFIATSDFGAKEELFPWTGFTILSRAMYTVRHMQHHLADLIAELQRRGVQPPEWQ